MVATPAISLSASRTIPPRADINPAPCMGSRFPVKDRRARGDDTAIVPVVEASEKTTRTAVEVNAPVLVSVRASGITTRTDSAAAAAAPDVDAAAANVVMGAAVAVAAPATLVVGTLTMVSVAVAAARLLQRLCQGGAR